MKRVIVRFAAELLLLNATLHLARAQSPEPKIRIALSLNDSAGVVSSTLRSSLRSLGDVEVVTVSEPADYRWSGVVLTSSDVSGRALTYTIALTLTEPISRFSVWFALRKSFPKATSADADSMVARLAYYEAVHVTWAASWGRDVYEAEARKLVAEFDSKCLEKTRILRRLSRLSDTESSTAFNEQIAAKRWLC